MLNADVLGRLNEKINAVNLLLEKNRFNTRFKLFDSVNGGHYLVIGRQEQLDFGTYQRVLVRDATEESVELVLTVVSSILDFEGRYLCV